MHSEINLLGLCIVQSIRERLEHLPQRGKLTWIGLRSERRGTIEVVKKAELRAGRGLLGDHRAMRDLAPNAKRQVTLLQHEHLAVIASVLGKASVQPEQLRRNLLISGINLLALKDRRFYIGEVMLEGTGPCHPCTRMEENLGEGGLNAVRGHGGITAQVLSDGFIRLGDEVFAT